MTKLDPEDTYGEKLSEEILANPIARAAYWENKSRRLLSQIESLKAELRDIGGQDREIINNLMADYFLGMTE